MFAGKTSSCLHARQAVTNIARIGVDDVPWKLLGGACSQAYVYSGIGPPPLHGATRPQCPELGGTGAKRRAHHNAVALMAVAAAPQR